MAKKKFIVRLSIWSISILVLVAFYIVGAWYMSPGSYAHAEFYQVNIHEDSLIKKIDCFKNLNPQYNVPDSTRNQDHGNGIYHHVYFYYPIEKRIVHIWTSGNNHVSTLAFVATWSINTKNEDYKEANGNFWWWKNRKDQNLFEERIFNQLMLKRN